MRILASEQVHLWLTGLPPDTKRRVRAAMKDLAASAAALDIKALRGELDGFYRLRVGHYRVIYHHGSGRTVFLDYADLRDEIYEAFRRLRALGESEEG